MSQNLGLNLLLQSNGSLKLSLQINEGSNAAYRIHAQKQALGSLLKRKRNSFKSSTIKDKAVKN